MGAPNLPAKWDIVLSSWIIQDGNYPDLRVGQTAEFALEFWFPDGSAGLPSTDGISASIVGDCVYDTVAEVVLQTVDITILDIGVLVFRDESVSSLRPFPPECRVAVKLGLGVDPFFYVQGLARVPSIPPLIYSWRILSILRQTAPFIERIAEAGLLAGHSVQIRDPHRLGYEEVYQTDGWNDDGGHAEYLLRCQLLPIPPKRTSSTAI